MKLKQVLNETTIEFLIRRINKGKNINSYYSFTELEKVAGTAMLPAGLKDSNNDETNAEEAYKIIKKECGEIKDSDGLEKLLNKLSII